MVDLGFLNGSEIAHPFRKDVAAEAGDIDGMAIMLTNVKAEIAKLRATECILRTQLANMTTGDAKTRRLVGEMVKLKIEMPSDMWQQSVLKTLWVDDVEMSSIYLRVDRLAPNLREVKKLENASGNARFAEYKRRLLSARQASTSLPVVTVENAEDLTSETKGL